MNKQQEKEKKSAVIFRFPALSRPDLTSLAQTGLAADPGRDPQRLPRLLQRGQVRGQPLRPQSRVSVR